MRYLFLALLLLPMVHAHYGPGPVGGVPGYGFLLTLSDEPPLAGKEVTADMFLYNTSSAASFTNLDTVHERKIHVLIVGEDLATFTHTHPEEYADGFAGQDRGVYRIHHTFPRGGNYLMIADYTIDGQQVINAVPIAVVGDVKLSTPGNDLARQKEFEGYAVELEAPSTITPGTPTMFEYKFTQEGMPVTNLQPYLGASMHVAVVKSDFSHADHAHPYMPQGHEHHAMHYAGPAVPIQYTFPTPGRYVLFGQFQHENTVVTTRFLVDVTDAPVEERNWPRIFLAIAAVVAILFVIYFVRKK